MRLRAFGSRKLDGMNGTERKYAQHLELLRHANAIAWWKFECLKFRLADNTYYTPDFAVMKTSGEMEMHEVKGFWRDDARVKIKVAADIFPFRFIAVKLQNNGWHVEEIGNQGGDHAA